MCVRLHWWLLSTGAAAGMLYSSLRSPHLSTCQNSCITSEDHTHCTYSSSSRILDEVLHVLMLLLFHFEALMQHCLRTLNQ